MASEQKRFELYRRVLKHLRPHRGTFFAALGCMVLYGASEGALPLLIKHVLDGVFDRRDEDFLKLLPILLIGFGLLRAFFDFFQQFLMSKVGHLVVRDIRNNVNDHLLEMSPGYFVKNSSANLLSRLTSDVVLVRMLLTDSAAAVLRDSIRIIALLIAAIYLDPVLAAIAFIAFPLGIYPVYRFGKRIRKLSKKGQDAIGNLSSLLQESMLGNKVVKIFGREDFERQRFQKENEELTKTFIRSDRNRALTGPVNEILGIAAVAGVILYGGYSVINGTRSQGDFIAFLASVFLLYDPFKKLSRMHNTIQQGLSGAERIFEVMDEKRDIQSPETPKTIPEKHDIELKNVSFRYQGEDQRAAYALRNISLHVQEGEKVALVGFSGAGKSTLVDLIPRFMDPTEGQVLLGGIDLREFNLEALRNEIAMVGQHTFLFHDTIFSNIAYGKEGATREDVENAAKAAYAYDFVSALPDGFDTVAGESGLTLSGGERQRIAIARALLKDAPILILDEATASLDNRSEREVQKALEALEQGRTTLVIAHRLSTVRNADRIVVLQDGQIVEEGNHEELLKKEGEYSRLYALQFADREPEKESFSSESITQ